MYDFVSVIWIKDDITLFFTFWPSWLGWWANAMSFQSCSTKQSPSNLYNRPPILCSYFLYSESLCCIQLIIQSQRDAIWSRARVVRLEISQYTLPVVNRDCVFLCAPVLYNRINFSRIHSSVLPAGCIGIGEGYLIGLLRNTPSIHTVDSTVFSTTSSFLLPIFPFNPSPLQ